MGEALERPARLHRGDDALKQDLEAGRPLEIKAVVGAVVELGERLGVPMPSTRAVYACAKLLDERRRAGAGPGGER